MSPLTAQLPTSLSTLTPLLIFDLNYWPNRQVKWDRGGVWEGGLQLDKVILRLKYVVVFQKTWSSEFFQSK